MRPSHFVRQTALRVCKQNKNLQTKCRNINFTFANQGKQGRAQDTAKMTTRRKRSEWSAFWKNLLRRYCCVRRLPDNFYLARCRARSLELAKGFEPPTL